MDHLSSIDLNAAFQAGLMLGVTLLWAYCVSGVFIKWRPQK